MITIEILSKEKAAGWVDSLHATKPSTALATLLAGDRWSCVKEAVVAKKVEGEIVGIATIAPRGEQMSGEPTIVAIYVLPGHRGQGIGFQLLEAAVNYMLSKGLEPIRIDALSSKVLRIVNRLPIEKRQRINVVDQSLGGLMDMMLED